MSENNPNEKCMELIWETLVNITKKKTSISLLGKVENDYQETIYKKGHSDD